MHFLKRYPQIALLMLAAAAVTAQTPADNSDDDEQLKLAALEALVSAPEDRALPVVSKVLAGNHSDKVKMRALFVLSQMELPEAQQLLLSTAKSGSGNLRLEAIRMIGIGGDAAALAGLKDIYANGDRAVRESVLSAYQIADDVDAVFQIAVNATDEKEFEEAVNILGTMDARKQLKQLRERRGSSESLIHAYAISGDFESLRELALDRTSPQQQIQALHGLGIVGDDRSNAVLVETYRNSASPDVKEAALQGMLIAGYDEGVLQLFQASDNPEEKRKLLRTLVAMDSDAVLDIIDATFNGTP